MALDEQTPTRNQGEVSPSVEKSPSTTAVDEGVIERGIRLSKYGYCGCYNALSATSPYFSLLLAAKGFDATLIGWVQATQPLASVFLLPPVTYAADRTRKGTEMTIVASLGAAVMLLAATGSTSLAIVGFAAVAHLVFFTPTLVLYDQHTMSLLPEARKNEWGGLRVWGAYGWGVGAPLAALLISTFGWLWMAVQYIGGTVLMCYTMKTTPVKQAPTDHRYRDVMQLILQNGRLVAFLCCVVLIGMGYVFISTYLFLFLEEELNAPHILLGLSVTAMVLVEVPLFQNSEWVHSKFSDRQLLMLSMVAWGLRVIGYSLLQNPWHVLFLEPLHGFTFGAMWLGGVHFMSTHFPKDLVSTAFGTLHATAFGVGPAIGNVVGGYLYSGLGPRVMFRCAAVVMLVACAIYYVVDARLAAKEEAAKANAAPEVVATEMAQESPRHAEDLHLDGTVVSAECIAEEAIVMAHVP